MEARITKLFIVATLLALIVFLFFMSRQDSLPARACADSVDDYVIGSAYWYIDENCGLKQVKE